MQTLCRLRSAGQKLALKFPPHPFSRRLLNGLACQRTLAVTPFASTVGRSCPLAVQPSKGVGATVLGIRDRHFDPCIRNGL